MKSSTALSEKSRSDGAAAAPARDNARVRRSPWTRLRHLLNRARLAKSYFRGEAYVSGFPAHLKIELTNYCNLACTFCPHDKMQRETGFMKEELFRNIIDQSTEHVEFVYLHFMGESLAHKKIFDMIHYAKEKGVGTGLSTNSSFLDEKRSRGLLTSDLDFLVISFEGANPTTYETVRRMKNYQKGDYEKTLANIQGFYHLKTQIPNAIYSTVQVVHTTETHEELEAFQGLWPEGVTIKKMKTWGGQMPELTNGNGEPIQQTPCALPWKELSILWDGTATLCSNTYDREIVLGDARRQTIREIWNGPVLREIRRRHAAGHVKGIPVCETCPRYAFNPRTFLVKNQLSMRLKHYSRNGTDPKYGLS
ncbi:MAG: radical SAM/SPASM domain-containing protein [Nitrospinota bacterium]